MPPSFGTPTTPSVPDGHFEQPRPSPDATVVIGDFTFTDDLAQYEAEENTRHIFADYLINSHYKGRTGIWQMGANSPDGFGGSQQTVSFVQLNSPTLTWYTDWTAARFGEPPPIPNPDPENTDWILLAANVTPASITVGADGEEGYYRISGTYIYGHKRPPQNMTGIMAFPRPPWLSDTFSRTVESGDLFERNLMNIVQGEDPDSQEHTLEHPVILPR